MKVARGRLQLWLFGPGSGEFVAVHVPPNGWLSIDGCTAGGVNYPMQFFEAVKARPTHIVMSHPHLDHAAGVQDLVEWATAGDEKTWPRWIGAVPSPRAWQNMKDLPGAVRSAQARGALAAMSRCWRANRGCQWALRTKVSLPLGHGHVQILSPTHRQVSTLRKELQRRKKVDWNHLASAIEVTWNKERLVLGSDLENRGWNVVLRSMSLKPNVGLKVSHHGSFGAQHRPLLERSNGVFLATPFASEGLPRFGDGDGMHVLLEHTARVYLTGLPQAYGTQNRRPRRYTRAELAGPRATSADDEPRGFPDSWVKLTIDESGTRRVTTGPGSVVVTET